MAKRCDDRYQHFVGYWFIKKEPVSKPPVPIAVADFVNETNEEELNGLSGMLITALEQSRQLSVLTRSRMFDILKQLRKEKVERVDEPAAREICKHANVNALVIASIRKFDQLYTIDLKVIDPIEEQYLFTAGEKGEGKASVPAMIDKLSEKTQNGLKIQDIEKESSRQGVAAVTTANLDAYYHFFKGMEFWYKLQNNKAEEELKNAIAIDSTFGLPYALLAIIKIGTPDEHLAREPLSKALRYLNRTPLKERYLIRAIDAYFKKGHKAAIDELKDMSQLYPDDKRVYLGLGYFYLRANQYSLAKENLDKALELVRLLRWH